MIVGATKIPLKEAKLFFLKVTEELLFISHVRHVAYLRCFHHPGRGIGQQLGGRQQLLGVVQVHLGLGVRPHGVHQI